MNIYYSPLLCTISIMISTLFAIGKAFKVSIFLNAKSIGGMLITLYILINKSDIEK